MNFLELRTRVQDAMGRTDVPLYVYDLMIDDMNNDLRVLEMQATTTLTASSEVTNLPDDFLSVESLYTDTGSVRTNLTPITEQSQATGHDRSGRPYYYAIHDLELTLMPVPDGEYDLTLRYYARLPDLENDTDTSAAMSRYRQVFFYNALAHAAVWAKDAEMAQLYNSAYTSALSRTNKRDIKDRISGPMGQRSPRW